MKKLIRAAESITMNGIQAVALLGVGLLATVMFVVMPIFIVGFIVALAFFIDPALGVVAGICGLVFLISAAITGVKAIISY